MTATFDHVCLKCPAAVFEDELKFLNAALAPLGIKEQFRVHPLVAGLGNDAKKPDFWIGAIDGPDRQPIEGPVTRIHVAFKATSECSCRSQKRR
jgi:hypothetical protein